MDEIGTWLVAFWQARADMVLPTPGGCAILTPTFSGAHDHNKLLVVEACAAGDLTAAADEVLAGYDHRRIEVYDRRLADALEPGLGAAGYAREDDLVMVFGGAGQASSAVEPMDLEERISIATAAWAQEQPSWAPELWRQLGERATTAGRAAEVTHLGIRVEGALVARADLFRRGAIAQIEEVMTEPAHQGKGYASQIVLDAVQRADTAQVFLCADANDWPKDLYRKLGFVQHSQTAIFTR